MCIKYNRIPTKTYIYLPLHLRLLNAFFVCGGVAVGVTLIVLKAITLTPPCAGRMPYHISFHIKLIPLIYLKYNTISQLYRFWNSCSSCSCDAIQYVDNINTSYSTSRFVYLYRNDGMERIKEQYVNWLAV